ncbi:MAG: T9SS C-terminal target domain-containing protein [Haliscomenobacteraceae bacterium CHB4]|nr:hypothetical protein [Saprospiraceae bacterium]MCE7925216.1 T9SS C-terminal target domain-containing protein [Haliscomenobacteraceae bacterium CHB4]
MKHYYLLPVFLLLHTLLSATPAPDFTVTTSDGQVRKLYQDYVNQQKLVVLEIFFTTCPPCGTHAPYWQTLYQDMQTAHPGKVEFLLLSDKSADTDPVVNAYLASKGLTMPAAGSSGGSLAAVQPYKSGTFGLFYGTPTFVVIAPGTGEVFFDIRGNSPQETMALIGQQISDLLPVQQDCFLKSYFDNPVPDVQLTVDAPSFDTVFTASGSYSVSSITPLQSASYTITPFKSDNPLQGISTWDLVLMSKHILGLDPLTEPWQLIAADLNCSGTITTFDIIEGRKLILGISSAFSGCGGASWVFVADPGDSPANGSCINFRGVKLGDLTGPYFSPGDPADDRNRARLSIENRRMERGQTYRIHLRTRQDFRLMGFQLAFGLDPAALRIRHIESPVLRDFDEQHYNLELQRTEGYVPVSWLADGRPVEIGSGDILLTLEVEALHSGLLSDFLRLRQQLRAEAYEESGKVQELEIEWSEHLNTPGAEFSLSPNPAGEAVFLSFPSENEREILLQLIDMQGKVVLENTYTATKGMNGVELRPGAPLSGLYFVKKDGKAVGKVVFGK